MVRLFWLPNLLISNLLISEAVGNMFCLSVELRAEIEKLHRQAGNIRGGDHPLIDCTENAMLRQQLRLKEKEIMELSRWVSGGGCCTVLGLCDGTVQVGQWGWLLYSVGTM